jgi:hypothetical protein
VLLRASVLASLALAATADVTDRRSYTLALPASRTVSVELTVGHLRVLGEARSDVVVEVVRSAPSADRLAQVPVTVDESDDAVRISGIQADGATDPALKTDVTLRVPRTAILKSLRVLEGRMTLSSLAGEVTADLRRGPIAATRLEGVIRLETGIGDIEAVDLRLSPDGVIRLRAFNGDVRLHLAERPTHARVMALVLDGTIKSQIPLHLRDSWGPRWGETTLGKGEPVISLDVVTGDIDIRTPAAPGRP